MEDGGDDSSQDELHNIKCLKFMGELRQCVSSSNQFHQYYIYGKFHDCSEIKKTVKSCIGWRTFRSETAKEELKKSLKLQKSSMHTPNPVWKMREVPPDDW